jgi:tight adherence protein C
VVIIIPLVLFIFPVIFVVLIGPAILSLIHGLGGLGF